MTLELALGKKEIKHSSRGKSFSDILNRLEADNVPFEIVSDISGVTEDVRGHYIDYSGIGLNAIISSNNVIISRLGELSESDRRTLELIEKEYPNNVEKLPWFVKLILAAPFIASFAIFANSLYSGKNSVEEALYMLGAGVFLLSAGALPHAIGYCRNKTPKYWSNGEILASRLKNLTSRK